MPKRVIVDAPTEQTKRVSLRWDSPDGARDVVGHLIAANADWLVILPEDRGPVWVPRPEARNMRDVPERKVLPASAPEALQRVLDKTWPGSRRARLGGWVLRQGAGSSWRANSVLAAGDPGVEFAEAHRLAAEWAGGPVRLQVVIGSPTQAQGKAAGLKVAQLTRVMTLNIGERWAVDVPSIRVTDAPDDSWLAGWDHGGDEARRQELTAAPASYLRLGSEAIGRVAFFGGWAVLTDIEVAPASRGRGLGRTVTKALLSHAAKQGVSHVALQVQQTNNVAVKLYETLGFVEHHRYGYLLGA